MASNMYVEFPVDPLIEIVLPKKKHDGGGTGPPYLCGGGLAETWSPVFTSSPPHFFGFGFNLGGPDALYATFEASCSLVADEVPFVPGAPGGVWERPGYGFSGVTLLLGVSVDGGVSFAPVASSAAQTINEGGTFSASVSYQMAATDDINNYAVVGFAVTGELSNVKWPWWLLVVPPFFGTATTIHSVFCRPPPVGAIS
jgi:hypothetical protein